MRVWATRPESQNKLWAAQLRELGFTVLELPLMAITPVDTDEDKQAIKNSILSLDEFSKLVFVSQNAVTEAFIWIDQYWPQLPVGIEFFAVGKKTAQSIQAHGVEVRACREAMNSDELLAMPELTDVGQEKILICRGKGGLPRLGAELTKRGASVRYCELYRRSLPESSSSEVIAALKEYEPGDIVPVFSGESLANLDEILHKAEFSPSDIQILVPGDRVAQLASEAGFSKVYVAKNASNEEMLDRVRAIACI